MTKEELTERMKQASFAEEIKPIYNEGTELLSIIVESLRRLRMQTRKLYV